jgi:hypothetical protein
MGDNLPKNFIWKIKSPIVPEKQSEMGQVKITVSDDDFTEPISESNTTKTVTFSPQYRQYNTVKVCYSKLKTLRFNSYFKYF